MVEQHPRISKSNKKTGARLGSPEAGRIMKRQVQQQFNYPTEKEQAYHKLRKASTTQKMLTSIDHKAPKMNPAKFVHHARSKTFKIAEKVNNYNHLV
jgi:hypothetical protein